jgi:transcriptional regulator with XRE-family HTH domain
LHHKCQELNLTVQGIADEAGVARSHLYKLASGATRDPSVLTLARIAMALHVPPVALFRLFMGQVMAPKHSPQTTVIRSRSTPGDVVAFCADVTVPDHALMVPGEHFRKTWCIQNAGTVPWVGRWLERVEDELVVAKRVGVSLEPVVESHLAAAGRTITVRDAQPGMAVEVSMDFVAPMESCSAVSLWRMRNPDGRYAFPPQFVLQVVVTVVAA